MSTTTLTYPTVTRVRHALAIGIIAILILTSLALIASAILVIISSPVEEPVQADLIPVARDPIVPIAVAIPAPTPPTADIQPISSKTPVPASMVANEPSAIPVPVPTPPSL